jgi:hypothetical protein
MPNEFDAQEMIRRQLEIMRLMKEDPDRFEEQSDQPISDQDIRENLGGIATDMHEKEIRAYADRHAGEMEPIKPYRGEGSSKIEQRKSVEGDYAYGDKRKEQGEDERGRGGEFLHGTERVPLGLWEPRDVQKYGPGSPYGSYLDPYKGDLIKPQMGPGMRMREGQYNQGIKSKEVQDFLQQLMNEKLGGY